MISSYHYQGREVEEWDFQETALNNVNLIVGASGCGKTRYLNTIFNIARFIALGRVPGEPFMYGYWKATVITEEYEYVWEYDAVKIDGKDQIKKESLKCKRIDSQKEQHKVLIDRAPGKFIFCGVALPKLESDKAGITILKEEEEIRPLYEAFSRMQIRKFHDQALKVARNFQNVPTELIRLLKSKGGMLELWKKDLNLSAKMFLLKENFPEQYNLVIDAFKQFFTSIKKCDVRVLEKPPINIPVAGVVPLFFIKEKNVDREIPLPDLSSGMQKVLLLISDIITLPKGSFYMIDEYENSLGINAIDFLPEFFR